MVELCIHVANVFYLASFLGRDMLGLRALTCAGLVLGLVFFTCQPMPMYGPVAWHVVFLFINLYQIRQILRERQRLDLTDRQQQVAETALGHLSREDLLTLLTHVMYRDPRRVGDISQVCRRELSPEERALRDIAFSRLSRKELLNLATRRLWHSLSRLNPAKWRRRENRMIAEDHIRPITNSPAETSPSPVHQADMWDKPAPVRRVNFWALHRGGQHPPRTSLSVDRARWEDLCT